MMNKVAVHAFIRPFYQKTMGLWAFVLIFGGVLMEWKQHVLLGRFFFKNPIAFWLLPAAFLVFSLVHLRIQLGQLRKNNYLIFHQLGLFTRNESGKFWSQIILSNHSPLLAYFFFLSFFAWEQNKIPQGTILWLSVICLLGFNLWKIQRTLHFPLKEEVIKQPSVRWTFPRFTWVILSMRQNRPILLLLTKALGLLLLNGFYLSFQSGGYDFRWMQFGILCVSYLQLPLILEKTDTEVQRQSWVLALPLQLSHKLGYQLGSLGILIFPELLFLGWKGFHASHLNEYLILGIQCLSFVAGLQLLAYQKGKRFKFPQLVAGAFFLAFLGIVYGLPWIGFSIPIALLFLIQMRSPYQI